jgi:hypothetical protein
VRSKTSQKKEEQGDASKTKKKKKKKRRSPDLIKLTRRKPPGQRGHGLDAQTARRDLGDERAEHGTGRGD